MSLAVCMIVKDETQRIVPCLEPLTSIADEVIVVDTGSTDGTPELLRERFGIRVLHDTLDASRCHEQAAPRNRAIERARADWILSIDADERVTPELAAEIRAVLAGDPAAAGYRVPRLTWHLGRWIRSTDWYPDRQLRLYDRRRGRWTGRLVHESVKVDGPVADLANDLQHYAYRNLSHHLQTMDRYTTLAARQMRDEGRTAGWLDLALHPPAAFLRNYVLKGGFRDGLPGLVISTLNATYVALKFAKLWELCSHSTSTPRGPGGADNSRSS